MSTIRDLLQQAIQQPSVAKRHGGLRPLPRWLPRWAQISLVSLLAAALGVLGVNGWPLLGFGLLPASLWVLAFLGFVWNRPRVVQRRATWWAGAVPMVAGIVGALSIYQAGYGGALGDLMAGSGPAAGLALVAPLFLLGLAVLSPRRSWRASLAAYAHSVRGTRSAASYATRAGWYMALAAGHAILVTVRMAVRLAGSVARSYRSHPWHRPALWAARGVVRATRRAWVRRGARGDRAQPQLEDSPDLPIWLSGEPGEVPPETAGPVGLIAAEGNAPEELAEHPPGEELPALAPESASEGLAPAASGWALPPVGLLHAGEKAWMSEEENDQKARLIEQTLADYGIEVRVEEIRPGPVVTQFGLVPGWVRRTREVAQQDEGGGTVRDEKGRPVKVRVEEKTRVKVDAILSREKDLALALAALSIRFEAPVPGESFVGLEVPNARPAVVALRSVVESDAFRGVQRQGRLPIALGKGSGGEPIVADLAEMPHLLIAGATGSGKSVCMNSIICSLLMQFTPLELRLFLVDPKRVELATYNDLPHLLAPVLVEADQAVPALRSIIGEMKSRYKRFEATRVRNIDEYNRRASAPAARLPYIVMVIDELADLMMSASSEVEQALCRLAQLGRATGIHLVVATQRPSVDVLTGLIKANFPSRVSFAVSSQVDSRTILDGAGAEKLLGKGDMLFLPTDYIKPKRIQGAYISDDEVRALVAHWGYQSSGPLASVSLPVVPEQAEPPVQAGEVEEEEGDDLLRQAKALALSHGRISAPLLQRRLGIGYPRAEGLLDRLEERGIVEPGDPGKSRAVTGGQVH